MRYIKVRITPDDTPESVWKRFLTLKRKAKRENKKQKKKIN